MQDVFAILLYFSEQTKTSGLVNLKKGFMLLVQVTDEGLHHRIPVI